MNYYETFIQVAPDCPVTRAVVPVARGKKKPVHVIQYELLFKSPYTYTQEELIFEVHVRHKAIPTGEVKARRQEIWQALFAKPHACLRASLLPKQYGWGLHFDSQGKIALYPMESREYQEFVTSKRDGVKLLAAMRSRRAG
jgi:hypothetical protein